MVTMDVNSARVPVRPPFRGSSVGSRFTSPLLVLSGSRVLLMLLPRARRFSRRA